MALSTAGDLINYAFRISGINGVGQSASADDMTDALTALSAMVGQWQQKRWLTPTLTETALTSTGATTYTIGPGGAFNIARPDRIDAAFCRMLNSGPLAVDYTLSLIGSFEDYSAIALKNWSTLPAALFYESTFPLGVLHFWPIPPASAYELHVFTKSALPAYAALTDTLQVPAEYLEALIYSLVVRLEMNYGLDPKPAHVAAMRAGLATIRQSNAQIPATRMPPGLPGMRRGDVGSAMVGNGLGRAFILDGGSVLS